MLAVIVALTAAFASTDVVYAVTAEVDPATPGVIVDGLPSWIAPKNAELVSCVALTGESVGLVLFSLPRGERRRSKAPSGNLVVPMDREEVLSGTCTVTRDDAVLLLEYALKTTPVSGQPVGTFRVKALPR